MRCQACKERNEQYIVTSLGERPSYHLCGNCILQLVTENLSKEQFMNLLKSGHSANEFYLHSDFYDERGRALQPKHLKRW
jgi:hypothetical protein